MERLTDRFLRASLAYFVLGVLCGVLMIFWPAWPAVIRTVHVHLILGGWLSMIVYAAGYAAVPRLKGIPLYDLRLADRQFWLANVSLPAMNLFWIVAAFPEKGTLAYAFSHALLAISALSVALSVLLFVYNIAMTLAGKSSERTPF